ncbi:MAG: ATP-binding protein, partial [Chloroflexota bacterium]
MEENTPTGSTNAPSVCETCGVPSTEQFCNGTGFYDLDVPVGHPDFSKVFRCPNNPVEQDHSRIDRLRELSNLSAFSEKTFDNFSFEEHTLSPKESSSLKQAHKVALQFAILPQNQWLVLQGTYGSGKTHLAAAIGNARLEQGDAVLFITAPDLL